MKIFVLNPALVRDVDVNDSWMVMVMATTTRALPMCLDVEGLDG